MARVTRATSALAVLLLGATATVLAQDASGTTSYWTASLGYGARAHLNARASGGRADLVSLGHTYGPTLRASVAHHSKAGWVYEASFDDGRSNRSSDEVTQLFDAALERYPGSFFPDFGTASYAFQPDVADRYTLGFGRELALGSWTITPRVTAGVLDIRLGGIGRTYKQRDANALYDIRLRPSTSRLTTPVIGAGATFEGRIWRNFGLQLSGECYYARPRYDYGLVVRELVSGREDISGSAEVGAWLVGQLTASVSYRFLGR